MEHPWTHKFVQVNGIKMHYVTEGEGPLVVLLHGFPQFWYAWRHTIPELARYYKVVAPDMRGYGETEKPPHIEDYKSKTLYDDVAGLIHALGYEKAHLVGHDWGGAIALGVALNEPQVIDHLVVLNAPHPAKYVKALKSNFRQMCRSWYVFFFQLPYLPEHLVRRKWWINHFMRGWSIRKETFSDEDLKQYEQAINIPGAANAIINYYRAAIRATLKKRAGESAPRKIDVPTLLIWGEEDKALGKELTYNMDSLFTGPFHIEYIPNCSHWVNEEQPELVNQLILDFLSDAKLKKAP